MTSEVHQRVTIKACEIQPPEDPLRIGDRVRLTLTCEAQDVIVDANRRTVRLVCTSADIERVDRRSS